MEEKNLYIIAGCNGVGKTTASYTILPEIIDCKEFVNADEIAKGLSPFQPETVSFEAGRIMINRINDLLNENESFAFETTLSSRSYKNKILKAKEQGYTITLLFFWLNNIELAKERVKTRVKEGGHNIPEDVIERRGGEADGITRTEMVKRNPKNVFKTKFNKKTVIKAKGMESFPQCRVRAARVIKWINRNFKDKKILIVSHGDFGQMFYSAFYKIPWKQALDDFQFKNTNMLIMEKGRSPKTVILF